MHPFLNLSYPRPHTASFLYLFVLSPSTRTENNILLYQESWDLSTKSYVDAVGSMWLHSFRILHLSSTSFLPVLSHWTLKGAICIGRTGGLNIPPNYTEKQTRPLV